MTSSSLNCTIATVSAHQSTAETTAASAFLPRRSTSAHISSSGAAPARARRTKPSPVFDHSTSESASSASMDHSSTSSVLAVIISA